MNKFLFAATFLASIILVTSCSNDQNIINFDFGIDKETPLLTNLNSFSEFTSSIGIDSSQFIFTGVSRDKTENGAIPIFDAFQIVQSDRRKSANDNQIIAIPFLEEGEFTHLSFFSLDNNNSVVNIGSTELSYHNLGYLQHYFSKLHLSDYEYSNIGFNDSLEISTIPDANGAKTCHQYSFTYISYYQTVSMNGTTLGINNIEYTTDTYIQCDNSSPGVPIGNYTITITNGSNNSNNNGEISSASNNTNQSQWLKCSTWNFESVSSNGTTYGSTQFRNGSISVENQITNSFVTAQLEFDIFILTDEFSDLNNNSDFKKCITTAYNIAATSTMEGLYQASAFMNVNATIIQSVMRQNFQSEISDQICFEGYNFDVSGSENGLLIVDAEELPSAENHVSDAQYGTFQGYLMDCGF